MGSMSGAEGASRSAFRLAVWPEFSHLAGGDRQGLFVVQVLPPPVYSERPPVHMVLALDTSGSMEGPKLASAIQSAAAIVRVLGPHDSFACVTFAEQVQVLVPPTAMTPVLREQVLKQLAGARAEGSTDLAEGMLRALSVVEAGKQGQEPGRVLLLTDGCPTAGVTDHRQILTLAAKACQHGTLSTFGFGRDVNPHLLQGLAEAGKGNYSFIEEREPPVAAIAAEVGGLIMTVAAGVSLRLEPSAGVQLKQVLRPGAAVGPDAGAAFTLALPPLVAEEPVALVFELCWPGAVARPLALATLSARRTDTGEAFTVTAEVSPAVAALRGGPVPQAHKEIVLARAAVALHRASQLRGKEALAAAQDLDRLRGELAVIARLSGIEADQQVLAALQMLAEAQTALETAQDGRHDMVASSAALAGRRSTNVQHLIKGPGQGDQGSPQAPFTSPSQKFGLQTLLRALGNPPRPQPDPPRKSRPKKP